MGDLRRGQSSAGPELVDRARRCMSAETWRIEVRSVVRVLWAHKGVRAVCE